ASGVTEPRAPVSGLVQGWLASLSPLVSTSDAALRAKARSLSVGCFSLELKIEPVVKLLGIILANGPSFRARPQPPRWPAPIRINVSAAPRDPIADRPIRLHALYRARPVWRRCDTLWATGERNTRTPDMTDQTTMKHPTPLTSGTSSDFTEAGEPFALFGERFAEACNAQPTAANAMALATVDEPGLADVRMVSMKGSDTEGFVFYSHIASQKGRELAANPKAALLFHWKSLRRQVRIRGLVSEVTAAEADAY